MDSYEHSEPKWIMKDNAWEMITSNPPERIAADQKNYYAHEIKWRNKSIDHLNDQLIDSKDQQKILKDELIRVTKESQEREMKLHLARVELQQAQGEVFVLRDRIKKMDAMLRAQDNEYKHRQPEINMVNPAQSNIDMSDLQHWLDATHQFSVINESDNMMLQYEDDIDNLISTALTPTLASMTPMTRWGSD
jgi:chromosome segregation ATPase